MIEGVTPSKENDCNSSITSNRLHGPTSIKQILLDGQIYKA